MTGIFCIRKANTGKSSRQKDEIIARAENIEPYLVRDSFKNTTDEMKLAADECGQQNSTTSFVSELVRFSKQSTLNIL